MQGIRNITNGAGGGRGGGEEGGSIIFFDIFTASLLFRGFVFN